MVRKKTKPKEAKPEGYCISCKHGYDYHELDYERKPFLCKCPFFEFSKFLYHDSCHNFAKKQ